MRCKSRTDRCIGCCVRLSLLGALALTCSTGGSISAATFTVNVTYDWYDANPGDGVAEDESGNTTLRSAVEEANALAGADVIEFDASLINATLQIEEAQLLIAEDLTINGLGRDSLSIAAGLDYAGRIFEVQGGVTMQISGLSIRNSSQPGDGGVFLNAGTLTIDSCDLSGDGDNGGAIYNNGGGVTLRSSIVTGFASMGDGGGIYTLGGTVDITDSTFDLNSAATAGAALFNRGGTVTVARSTFMNGDTTGSCGGVLNTGDTGHMELVNCTFSGNFATLAGGAICNQGLASLTVEYSTITQNTAENAGGIYNNNATINVRNTIIAGNTLMDPEFGEGPDVWGAFTSLGHNIVGDDAFSTGFGATGDQLNVDPQLGPLQNNGGPTLTHALLAGSPAINAGDNAGAPATDQRGFTRIVGGTVDIGSYEVQ